MPITTSLESITLSLSADPSATVSVAILGATVYSWTSGGEERLFKSSKSDISGPAAIRGGIPICWPIFGPPPSASEDPKNLYQKLKQHGFARIDKWTFEEAKSAEDGQDGKLVFTLAPSALSTPLFTPTFHLTYTVILTLTTLTTTLTVANPTTSPIPSPALTFQSLLHTYLRLPSGVTPVDTKVTPLNGLKFKDKVQGGTYAIEQRTNDEGVGFEEGEVDRVYEEAPDVLIVTFKGSEGGYKITKKGLPDTTVWNPAAAKGATIGDMEKGGWDHYICVEPGFVSEFVSLPPGEAWEGSQTIEVL